MTVDQTAYRNDPLRMPHSPPAMERPHLSVINTMFQGERGANINIHNGTFIQNNQPPRTASNAHACYNEKGKTRKKSK